MSPASERPTNPFSQRRLVAVAVLPALVVIAALAYLLMVQDRLPADVATHWDASGQADGFTSRGTLPWMMAGLTAAVGAATALLALRPQTPVMLHHVLIGLPMGLVTFIVALVLATTIGQLDGGSQQTIPVWIIPAAIALSIAAGALAALIGGQPDEPPTTFDPAPAHAERIPLAPGETAVWAGRTPVSWTILAFMAAAMTLNTVVAVILGAWWLPLLACVAAVVVVGTSSFAVTTGPAGVRVAGIFGFPKVHVPLGQITSAEAGTAKATQFGGWGLRVRLNGDSAVLTRSGPALVIERTDGAKFHVSLDEPSQPASVVSALLDRRAEAANDQAPTT